MLYLLKRELTRYCPNIENKPPPKGLDENKLWWEEQGKKDAFASNVLRFVKKNPEYVFWEIFDFHGGEFSYNAPKGVFFENNLRGAHLNGVIEEMKSRSCF